MDWLIDLGYAGLFIGTFVAGTVLPLSSDVLLIGLLAAGGNPIACLVVATLGNWLGAMTSYYLGWYAKNLRLVRCHISGTQPLCYCENLVIEDCTFAPDADLAFEHSSLRATILSAVTSIVNPQSGTIRCHSCGEYIHDASAKAPDDCQVICFANID